jgi:hypothetical protein
MGAVEITPEKLEAIIQEKKAASAKMKEAERALRAHTKPTVQAPAATVAQVETTAPAESEALVLDDLETPVVEAVAEKPAPPAPTVPASSHKNNFKKKF